MVSHAMRYDVPLRLTSVDSAGGVGERETEGAGERVCFVVSVARSKRTIATMPMVIAKRNKKRMLLAAYRAVHAGCFRTDTLHHVVDGRSVAVAVKKHKNDDHDDGVNDEEKYR